MPVALVVALAVVWFVGCALLIEAVRHGSVRAAEAAGQWFVLLTCAVSLAAVLAVTR